MGTQSRAEKRELSRSQSKELLSNIVVAHFRTTGSLWVKEFGRGEKNDTWIFQKDA